MNTLELPITTLLVCGLGAWGAYLLLTRRGTAPKRTGTAVAAFLLAAILGRFPLAGDDPLIATWPSLFAQASCFIPAGCALAATVAVISCRSPLGGLAWFFAAVLANSALLIVGGAVIAGVANIVVNVGLFGALLLYAASPQSRAAASSPEPISEFSWLGCALVGLLSAGLLTALPLTQDAFQEQTATAAGSAGAVGFNWHDLGQALLIDHGVSLTAVSLLLFVSTIAVARMTHDESHETASPPTGGTMT